MRALPVALAALLLVLFAGVQASHAAFTVLNINTTVTLNQNTSATVTDIIKLSVNGTSVQEYSTDRVALNLSLSQWQNIIGPSLIEHIVNPKGAIYNFNFLPGPLVNESGNKIAYLTLAYSVENVTTVNQTGPRSFVYQFNDNVFNFQHAESGAILGTNTTLTIILPSGSQINEVRPLPDLPALGYEQSYKNATKLVWDSDEPLSQFQLTYTVQQSLQSEVTSFFSQLYSKLGAFSYVIIIVAIVLFVVYTYLKIAK